ncbi:ABC transporter substrate-binding protein [Plantibacter elymi (nom. nud.)]|nr:ABC transporter substrate-binding protein [Plantibacter sp. VKM Ac-1784]
MDSNAAAIMIRLGLQDRLVGTAAPQFIADYDGELRAGLESVPVLDQGTGNKEAVIAANPDLVTGMSALEIGGFQGNPTASDLAENGASALIACGVTEGGITTGIDATYRYITALAQVFDVADRGEALVDELKQEVAAATADLGDEPVRIVTVFAVPDGGAGIAVRGESSFANGVLTLAGGENIAGDQRSDFVTLSAEALTEADPEVIVAASGFTKLSDADFRDAILDSPLLRESSAVKNRHVVVVPSGALLSPGLLNVNVIRAIADEVVAAS